VLGKRVSRANAEPRAAFAPSHASPTFDAHTMQSQSPPDWPPKASVKGPAATEEGRCQVAYCLKRRECDEMVGLRLYQRFSTQ
jgi:hypothetical protein